MKKLQMTGQQVELHDLIQNLHQTAAGKSLISSAALARYERALEAASAYNDKSGATVDNFNEVRRALLPDLNGGQSLDINSIDSNADLLATSRLIALEEVVTNAYNNYLLGKQTKSKSTEPGDRFTQMLEGILGSVDKPNQEALERLIETKDNMIVSLVHTMHPVVYHTVEGRNLEKRLTEILENGEGIDKFNEEVSRFAEGMKDGSVNITPMQPTNTNKEAVIEDVNFEEISKEINRVVKAWNQTVRKLGSAGEPLIITPEEEHKMFELRTWGKFADADGRKKSNAFNLYHTIYGNNPRDVAPYEGPILDLRQNAAIHQELVSALIQKRFKLNDRYEDHKDFTKLCADFVTGLNEEGAKMAQSYSSPSESIYQELDVHGASVNKSRFLKKLIEEDVQVIHPEALKETRQYVREFNIEFWERYHSFIDENKGKPFVHRKSGEVPLPDNVTFDELANYHSINYPLSTLQDEFIEQHINEIEIVLEARAGGIPLKTGVEFNADEGQFYPSSAAALTHQYLKRTKKIDWVDSEESGEPNPVRSELSDEARAVCMDALRRLVVMKQAIDEGKFKDVSKLRHQIANFSGTDNFYEMLVLLRDTGLVKIKDNMVEKDSVQMGIMPLIETIADLKKAPDIFRELLADPLAKSYFKERGLAEIMVGFSDGAKSAGNFASQWEIYKATKELYGIFKENDIELRVFEGRGRGIDRGGPIDLGISRFMMPPELAKTAVVDMTIQGDLPKDMADSSSYGKDQLASLMIGVFEAREAALKQKAPEEQKEEQSFEKLADLITSISAKIFDDGIRRDRDTLEYIDKMPKNENTSTRATNRKKEKDKAEKAVEQRYDDTRAVPIEHRANTADLPFHNFGLKEALEEVGRLTPQELSEKGIDLGADIDGKKALQLFAMKHPFGRAIFTNLRIGMSNYDPIIADEMGRVASGNKPNSGVIRFINKIENSLDGLIEMMDDILPVEPTKVREMIGSYHSIPVIQRQDSLDTLSHALFSLFPDFRANRSDQFRAAGQILNNAIFGSYNEASHRGPNIVRLQQQTVAGALGLSAGEDKGMGALAMVA